MIPKTPTKALVVLIEALEQNRGGGLLLLALVCALGHFGWLLWRP